MLKLDKDLVFFDIESTGADVVSDKIIQIALIKYPKDGGAPIEKEILVNPQKRIKPDATAVHGFTNQMVKEYPPFEDVAEELKDFLGDCDLGGYNSNRFDVPMLIEEFVRVGIDFSMEGRRLIDCLQIFYKMEPRTLKAALKFYCGEDLKDAHDALADTRATAKVFFGQLEYYKERDYVDKDDKIIERPINEDIQSIHTFLNGDSRRVDFMGRFVRNVDGEICFNFGKHKGEVARRYPGFLNWLIQKDFPMQVKRIAQNILDGKM